MEKVSVVSFYFQNNTNEMHTHTHTHSDMRIWVKHESTFGKWTTTTTKLQMCTIISLPLSLSLSVPEFYLSEQNTQQKRGEKKQTATLPEITCVKNSDASEYE